MTEAYESLAAETDRIVRSPYPTQLKGLRDIVCAQCTSADVSKWAISRPCQVDRLAECLLEGLRQWPYVLGLLTELANEVSIRSSILRQSPNLLYDIVGHAVNEASPDSQYVVAAVTLLSHPLPDNVSAPSEAQTLFVRLFDRAADEPSLPNIRRVYLLLKGTSTTLLSLLPSSSLRRLEEHLFGIIRNIKGENQSLSLYCLAIMKIMSTASASEFGLSNSQYGTQDLLASTQLTSSPKWTTDAIQQFFTDGKAQKTLQLVVLRSMWACTTSTGEALDERMESLLLANEVISAVPLHLREVWRRTNPLVFRKLQEKVLAPALETGLRFQGLCFLTQAAGESRVPVTVLDSLRSLVVEPEKLRLALASVQSVGVERLLERGVFDEATVMAVLQHVADLTTSSDCDDWLETSKCLHTVLKEIYAAMANDTKLSEGTMLALDVIACGQKLSKLADVVENSSTYEVKAGRRHVCAVAAQNARRSLVHKLCKVFLRAALSSPHQSYSASQDTVNLLLDLHAASAPLTAACSHHGRPSAPVDLNFRITDTTSSAEQDPIDWRQATRTYLRDQAHKDGDSLTAVFAKACADLESRCEGVEAPLHEERAKRDTLQRQYADLKQAHASMEAELADHGVHFNARELERNQCISDLETQREETANLECRIEGLLQELQQARDHSEKWLTEAKTKATSAELDHAAAFARKEEEVEDLQAQLQRAHTQGQAVESEMVEMREQLQQAQESLQDARNELQSQVELNDQQTACVASARQERDDALAREKGSLGELKTLTEDATAQHAAFERDLSDLKQQAEHDVATTHREHDEKTTKLTEELDAKAQRLCQQLAEEQGEAEHARERHRTDMEQWEAELREKNKQVDRLVRKCAEKDKQIAEANAMRMNLMAAMGLDGQSAARRDLPPRTSRSYATQRSRYQEAESQDDASPPTPFSGDASQQADVDHISFASNATSSGESRNGPTPKRPRPRKSTKAPSPEKPAARMSISTRSGAHGSAAPQIRRSSVKVRQPLLGASGNQTRFPRRNSLKSPSKDFGMEEEAFEGSDLFAGTPGQESMDFVDALDEETETGL